MPWRHEMETPSALLSICDVYPPMLPVNQELVTQNWIFLLLAWTIRLSVIWDHVMLMSCHSNGQWLSRACRAGSKFNQSSRQIYGDFIGNRLRKREGYLLEYTIIYHWWLGAIISKLLADQIGNKKYINTTTFAQPTGFISLRYKMSRVYRC